MFDGSTYRRPTGLSVDVEAGGWAHVREAGAREGILLDPHVYQIWSAASGSTLVDVAARVAVSTYLVACIVALLERTGLLARALDPAGVRDASVAGTRMWTANPGVPRPAAGSGGHPPIPAIVIHHHAQADLDACLRALSLQGDGVMGKIRVLASAPLSRDVECAAPVECDPGDLTATLREALDSNQGDAVLLLDSQITLASDAVAAMAHVLDLRADVAAVTPRVMWQAWPAIVVALGDWRLAPDEVWHSPHTGHVDVGQFAQQWQETPGVHFQAALLRGAVLQRVRLPHGGKTLDWLGAEWSAQARTHAYRTVAALQALAYGPWPAVMSSSEPAQDRNFPGGGLQPLVEDGLPALTVESVRAVYCHHTGVAPGRVRPRVSLVAARGSHATAIVDELASTCEVSHFELEHDDGVTLRDRLRDTDVVVASEEAIAQLAFLQQWPAPILLDAPPAEPGSESASALLRMVDGAVCIKGTAAGGVPESDRSKRLPDGRAWVMAAGRSSVNTGTGTRPRTMPLADYCHRPVMTPEREIEVCLGPSTVQPPPPPPTPAGALPAKAWQMLRQRGAADTVREVGRYVRWKVGL